MRKIREVLRLRKLGLSQRKIARSVRLGQSTVSDYLLRLKVAKLSWDEIESLDDVELERRLFPGQGNEGTVRPHPDWPAAHQELKRKGVTLSLLWQEYKAQYPDGFGYSRYCDLYRSFRGTLDVSLRQEHIGGEKLFVDYAGQTMPIHDRSTGEIREAQIFVAALGASHLIYAEATFGQDLRSWIGSHVRCFEWLGGVPEVVVPDNLKSGVTSPCRYEPEVNRTYAEMASHYDVAVIPARVRRPQDKAKVENGVLQVTRWILARLRNQKFFSLVELNEAIRDLLVELNDRPLKVLGISRRELFERVDAPALRALPEAPYVFARWKKVRVGVDYHCEFEGHYYSVPYQLIKEELDLRATETTIETFHRGKRVAAHRRDRRRGKHTTVTEHMPKSHQAHVEWTPKRLVRWALRTGDSTSLVVEGILRSRPHPQQGFRACLGLMRLGKRYGDKRVEAACARAIAIESLSYQSVKSILKSGLDQHAWVEETEPGPLEHANVRGAEYYEGLEEEAPC